MSTSPVDQPPAHGGPSDATIKDAPQPERDLERLQRQLQHQEYHDPLTDLPNRRYFSELVAGALTREPLEAAILIIDLDDFQLVNDVAGHTSGDQLLRAFAARLNHCIRRSDMAARLGGDEFAVLLDGIVDTDDALAAARHLHQDLRQPLELNNEATARGCSIGLAVARPSDTVADVMRRADVALYAAKREGKDTVANFDHNVFELMKQRHGLVRDLQRAIEGGDIRVAYQPIVHLDTGYIHSVETLARWDDQHDERIRPEVFVRAAEEHGLIEPLFEYMLHRSLAEAKPWLDTKADLQVHVNLSPVQMRQQGLAPTIGAALAEASVMATNVTIEITESVLAVDQEVTRQNLADLVSMGIDICLDDFGTGYSSLAYLMQFAPSMLKLDRSFVEEMGRTGDTRLPRSILFLARELGIEGVAEGIETVDQWLALRDIGWTLGQGFLMSEGVSAPDFTELLGTSLLPTQDHE